MTFLVKGRVTSEDGKAIPDLVVDAYDDDLFIDDHLGFATTDIKGFFEIKFEVGAFRSIIDRESRPDIYLTVKTPEGQIIHKTDVRRESGSVEEFIIIIDVKRPVTQVTRTCSLEQPMYCTTDKLEKMFEIRSLSLSELVNSAARRIDVDAKTVHDDSHWKGFYAVDSLLPPWLFQSGFYKKFSTSNGGVIGVTCAFDEIVSAKNVAKAIDSSDSSKGVILEYTEPQFSLFYDILKIVSEDVVIGKAYMGKYPAGVPVMTFAMTRKYNFDFMTAKDHHEIFEKHGKVPDQSKILGEWEGRMVSNTCLTPPLFRLKYLLDVNGKVINEYIFMYLLRGNSRVEFTPEQMNMFDFTNFHDEIRMVKDDFLVGKYLPEEQEILNLLGDRSLGLIHFEKTSKGTRPCLYYSLTRVFK